MLTVAVAATAIWTALSEPKKSCPTSYPKLFAWFRFTIRLTLGVAMFGYGMAKVFPLQMAPPSLAVLNEPFGNLSPMTLLWTIIGLHPVYEMICGAAEVIAGALILFRRTALLGALITAFVVTNVVLYNFFFDVPVKIYAAHLLLMSLVLIVPDANSLFRYFYKHEPAAPHAPWYPTSQRRWFRRTIFGVECWIAFIVAVALPVTLGIAFRSQISNARTRQAFNGQWHLDSATLNGQPKPFLTGDGLPMTDLFIEPHGQTMVRDSATILWRSGFRYDEKKHTASFNEGNNHGTYALTQPDPTHMVLTPTGDDVKKAAVLTFTRVPLPSHYPLLDRGFHLVNEWGLER